MRGNWWLLGLALSLSVLTPRLATAETLEKLLMPGEVIKGHAKFESKCENCHEPFSKKSQRRLCMACHKEITRDIEWKSGFHGHSKAVREVECKQCHTDHIGREADIVRLDKDTFDHQFTDFQIRGGHQKVECTSCHIPPKKYRDAPPKCSDCHAKIEPHKGRLGKVCADCHSEKGWRTVRFDHDKTKFPLKDKHREVSCKACHPNERYKNTPTKCFACHALNDVHGTRFGDKCESCHSTKGWKKATFDHDKNTKFPLKGAHRKIICRACHKEMAFKVKPEKTCISCHKEDDEHKGSNGVKCGDCHSNTAWTPALFDHDRKTKFPLRGRHKGQTCQACHKEDAQRKNISMECVSCHKKDDVHKGKQGKTCQKCHNERGWTEKVFFDHDLTKFPLIGLHVTTPCEECHLTPEYKGTSLDCVSCHEKDDSHKRRLGTDCASCHNPNGWRLWLFDHDKQTDFKLDGAHKGLTCIACHKKPVSGKIKQSKSCYSCHQKDDKHRGRFGRFCERCHVTEKFDKIKLNR